jgi:hypothetical protein
MKGQFEALTVTKNDKIALGYQLHQFVNHEKFSRK